MRFFFAILTLTTVMLYLLTVLSEREWSLAFVVYIILLYMALQYSIWKEKERK